MWWSWSQTNPGSKSAHCDLRQLVWSLWASVPHLWEENNKHRYWVHEIRWHGSLPRLTYFLPSAFSHLSGHQLCEVPGCCWLSLLGPHCLEQTGLVFSTCLLSEYYSVLNWFVLIEQCEYRLLSKVTDVDFPWLLQWIHGNELIEQANFVLQTPLDDCRWNKRSNNKTGDGWVRTSPHSLALKTQRKAGRKGPPSL